MAADTAPWTALADLIRQAVPAEYADALIENVRTELAGERLTVPAARNIVIGDTELLALHRACDGDAASVARQLHVSRRQVLNRLARLVRPRY